MLRGLIEALYQRLGWEESPGESVQHTKLRATIIGLGVYSEHPEITAQAQTLFEAYRADPETNSHVIPTELRSIVFSAAVRSNLPGAFEYLLDTEESTNDVDLKQDIVGALTLTHDTSQVQCLLDRLKDSARVRPQDLDRQLIYLMRNRYGREAAWKWLRDNWTWIEKTFGGDKSYDNFPRYAASSFNTRKLLEEYHDFFSPMQDQPALNRNITMGIEELENRISWIERDLSGISTFFARYAG